jgi:hypothetical protein
MLVGVGVLLLSCVAAAQQDRAWTLSDSTLTYHMSHPVHEVDGVSHAARGKGLCHAEQCEFLIAAPVKSFDSGDSNRDLHMLQTTRGAQFPLVTVRFRLGESHLGDSDLKCDLEVEFAGQKARYQNVLFHQQIESGRRHITGTVPSTLQDFKIDPPSFLLVPIKNEIPVRVDVVWVENPERK